MPNALRRTLAAALLAAGLSLPALPAHADTATPVPIGGGSGIVQQLKQVTPGGGYSFELCTLTAIGHDAEGNLVGLTNAHCFLDADGNKLVGDTVYDNTTPAGTPAANAPATFDFDATMAIGPIGKVTYVSEPNNLLSGGPKGLDYAVIKLDPAKVTPTATVSAPNGSTTIDSIGQVPGFGTRMCKMGHTTGVTCGITLGTDGPWYLTAIWTSPGDSGSPVVNGTALTGTAFGLQHFTPITSILADMNARGGVGAGFHIG
ncbi:trypsin-like peptidase domain-containing protein [Actinomadura violacea]|uniref:Trypsin-like peptidase domain-containing protein n=1 Tax=Actinomadura violacea TaxID=2819934 RepID=A0ABS3SA99_9ACTN|nr:trypsin-like peptidase domain-containing protein [Actinomadura violacea]MBO2465678.1 trypsin-like peptidase domain-containing protein [Actinomadura violacea]